MFTIQQIEEALLLAKSTGDYTKYAQDLNTMGISCYEVFVADGHTNYFDEKNFSQKSGDKYAYIQVADFSDKDKFLSKLKTHKDGHTDYMTFCKDAAEAGIEKWKLDFNKLTCTYFNKQGHIILEETIQYRDNLRQPRLHSNNWGLEVATIGYGYNSAFARQDIKAEQGFSDKTLIIH